MSMRPLPNVLSRRPTWVAGAVLIVSTLAHGQGQGLAEAYRGASQAWAQQAEQLTGADRACALAWSRYYACVAPLSNSCMQPSCQLGSGPGGGSGGLSGSYDTSSGSLAGAGSTPLQRSVNSAFQSLNALVGSIMADRAATRDARMAAGAQLFQDSLAWIKHHDDDYKAEQAAAEIADKVMNTIQETEPLQLEAAAGRMAAADSDPPERQQWQQIDDLLNQLAGFTPAAPPDAEPVLDGSNIPSVLDFTAATSGDPDMAGTPANPPASPSPDAAATFPPTSPAAAGTPPDNVATSPVNPPGTAPSSQAMPSDSTATGFSPGDELKQLGSIAVQDVSAVAQSAKDWLEHQLQTGPDQLVNAAANSMGKVFPQDLTAAGANAALDSINASADGNSLIPSVILDGAGSYLTKAIGNAFNDAMIDWTQVNSEPLGREMFDMNRAMQLWNLAKGPAKYAQGLIDNWNNLMKAGSNFIFGTPQQ
jgi:hypothetical protein